MKPDSSKKDLDTPVLGDFRHFLAEHKRWWLTPILAILLLLFLLAVLGEGPAIPFIYKK